MACGIFQFFSGITPAEPHHREGPPPEPTPTEEQEARSVGGPPASARHAAGCPVSSYQKYGHLISAMR
jgi:hypothetical protein